ncbi:MAG: HIT family protein [Vallitaleaceae bacterium]|nr:HIT family protein [Vallitaleaceae bacterium]
MSDCIFCKIIDGEIPSYTIYEDEDFKVILDAFPGALGHTLILPKEHIADVFCMDSLKLGLIHQLAGKIAEAIKDVCHCDGVNILQNNGIAAGQTVFHYHIHIIPRFDDDGMRFGWATKKFSNEELESIRVLLTKKI